MQACCMQIVSQKICYRFHSHLLPFNNGSTWEFVITQVAMVGTVTAYDQVDPVNVTLLQGQTPVRFEKCGKNFILIKLRHNFCLRMSVIEAKLKRGS